MPENLAGDEAARAFDDVADATRLRRALAGALAGEGLTTREIGARFGVSHQRVSKLLAEKDSR